MSNSYGVAARRPVLLSIVTILMIIGGLIAIAGGVAVIALRNDERFRADVTESPNTILGIGIAAIISGLISILLAMGLRRGSRIARGLVAIYEVLHIIAAIFAIIRLDHGTYFVGSIVSIVIALLILYYLYGTQTSREFFGS